MASQAVITKLRRACKAAGGQSAFALKAGITPSYVSNVLSGRMGAGPAILAALDMKRKVVSARKRTG